MLAARTLARRVAAPAVRHAAARPKSSSANVIVTKPAAATAMDQLKGTLSSLLGGSDALPDDEPVLKSACGDADEDDDDEMEEMFVQGPMGMEYGGPTRGGRMPEPTRFGDWERKGRTSDF